MPSVSPIYITDPSGQQWLIAVDNTARYLTIPVSGVPSAPASIAINNPYTLQSYAISIVGNPPPSPFNWGDVLVTGTTPYTASNPSQLPIVAPNGTIYALALDPNTSRINVVLANQAAINCNVPISSLAVNVQNRLEELPTGPPGTFWSYSYEILMGLEEAICDLLLLVGRPTQAVQVGMSLTPNSVWQTLPKGIFAISDIWGGLNKLKKITLADLDYSQPSWDSSWESDSSTKGPFFWSPIGLNMFVVYPAPAAPTTVLLDGIAFPFAETIYPPSGNEISPFHAEIEVYLEEYTAHILRLKEATSEFQGSLSMYKSYLEGARRLSVIEDRRDSNIFSTSFGASAKLIPRTQR